MRGLFWFCMLSVMAFAHGVPSAASNSIKWHPGHYMWLDPNHSSDAIRFAAIDGIGNETNVQGIQLIVKWALLEGPTKGDYSKGFAFIDSHLVKLGSVGTPKRLILQVADRAFGSGIPSPASAASTLPSYLFTSEYNGGYVTPDSGQTWSGSLVLAARVWEQPVMDRLIALSQAYAARYDQHPLFEMFGMSETALGVVGNGNSASSYSTQIKRWYAASKAAWVHTQLRQNANYLGSDAQMSDLINTTSLGGGVAVGGPDPEFPLPAANITRKIQANQIFRNAAGGFTDLRGIVPWVGEVQALGFFDRDTSTPAQLFDYQYNTVHASYFVWLSFAWGGGADQKWSTGILPFIRSINGLAYTGCPTSYGGRCSAGTETDESSAFMKENIGVHANPNPFHSATTLQFSDVSPEKVVVFDLRGRKVAELAVHQGQAVFEGKDAQGKTLTPGVYTAVFRNGTSIKSSKLLLVN